MMNTILLNICKKALPKRLKSNRGGSLFMALMITFVVAILSAAIIALMGTTLRISYEQQRASDAFNLAESGVDCAVRYLRSLSTPPGGTNSFDPFGGIMSLGDGTFQVTITPDSNNTGVYLKKYYIVSTGVARGITQKIEVTVRQASFGRFAYFTDSEVSAFTGDAIYFKAGEIVDGPCHSNSTGNSPLQINYNGSTAPIFLDTLTTSSPNINFTPRAPWKEAIWKQIFKDGSKGYKTGVDRIELPVTSYVQKNAAAGSSTIFPTSTGVYLPANGGIYIVGDSNIAFSVDSAGHQVVTVKQQSGTWITTTTTTAITINTDTGQTDVSKNGGSITHYSGLPNGVIYDTGDVDSVSGTIADNVLGINSHRSAVTVATDVSKGGDIRITGNLLYKTRPDKNKPVDADCNRKAGVLGLVASDIVIDDAAPQNLEIDAVLMAGAGNKNNGSFYADDYNRRSTGNLTILGGIIQKSRGPVGTFDAGSGRTTSGYNKLYHYDPRLIDNPPPFYPTTGTFERLSWRKL